MFSKIAILTRNLTPGSANRFSDWANRFSDSANWSADSANPKKQLAESGNRLFAYSENRLANRETKIQHWILSDPTSFT